MPFAARRPVLGRWCCCLRAKHRLLTPSLLIFTDFFRAANEALDYATNLARPLGARLVLLHIRRDSLLDLELLTAELPDLSQEAPVLALRRTVDDLAVSVALGAGWLTQSRVLIHKLLAVETRGSATCVCTDKINILIFN